MPSTASLVTTFLLAAAGLAEVSYAGHDHPLHFTPRPNLSRRQAQQAKRQDAPRQAGTLTEAEGCNSYYTVQSGDTCYKLAEELNISPWTNILVWNSDLEDNCENLYLGFSYCMGVQEDSSNGGSAKPKCSATSSAAPSSTPTATSTSSSEPSPTRTRPAACSSSEVSSPDPEETSPGETDEEQEGIATWYYTGLGACGITNNDSELVVAVSHEVYDTWPGATLDNPNNNPICGNKIDVQFGDKNVQVTVVDRCHSCDAEHIDLSPAAFLELAELDDGLISVEWSWVS